MLPTRENSVNLFAAQRLELLSRHRASCLSRMGRRTLAPVDGQPGNLPVPAYECVRAPVLPEHGLRGRGVSQVHRRFLRRPAGSDGVHTLRVRPSSEALTFSGSACGPK